MKSGATSVAFIQGSRAFSTPKVLQRVSLVRDLSGAGGVLRYGVAGFPMPLHKKNQKNFRLYRFYTISPLCVYCIPKMGMLKPFYNSQMGMLKPF